MSSVYDLTKEDIKKGIKLCLENVKRLLDDAEAIIEKDNGSISSGLYSYAVEETGRLLLLEKELTKTPNADNKIAVDPKIFSDHFIKTDEFKDNNTIPDECKNLRHVTGGIYNGSKLSGALFATQKVDLWLRMKIFFLDWKDGAWVRHLDIETSDLQMAITGLRKWINKYTIS